VKVNVEETERANSSLSSLAAALLTRRPHTWSRCSHAFSHLGPGWGHFLWCKGVFHSSEPVGIHDKAPAKLENGSWAFILFLIGTEDLDSYIGRNCFVFLNPGS
jgi:hypothetical protein